MNMKLVVDPDPKMQPGRKKAAGRGHIKIDDVTIGFRSGATFNRAVENARRHRTNA